MSNATWLDNLQPGDEVAVIHGGAGMIHIERVDSTTKTQIIVDIRRYKRSTGREIGGSRWFYFMIAEPTPDLRERMAEQVLRRKCKLLLEWAMQYRESLQLTDVQSLVDLIEKAKEGTETE